MRRTLLAGLAVALVLGGGQVQAQQTQEFTGLNLAMLCHWTAPAQPKPASTANSKPNSATAKTNDVAAPGDINRCVARILGTIDGVIAGEKISNDKPKICLPPNTSVPDQTGAVRKYAGQHSDALKEGAGLLIRGAIEAAYPCH